MPERLVACGLSHRTAEVGLREALAVPGPLLAAECRTLAARVSGEAVILSTCNRVEAYAFAGGDAMELARSWFRDRGGPATAAALSYWGGAEAVRHLFRVAAGLDSMVVGETEILGQARAAYGAAREAGTARRAMNLLFQAALCCGKRVRASIPLSAGIRSVGGAAAALAGRVFAELSRSRILILGAGKMGASSARHLLERGASRPVVANRSQARARELAAALDGEGVSLEEGLRRLPEFDVVLCATACCEHLITASAAAEALRRRRGRPLLLIDLGVPRNVDPGAGRVDGVVLYDVDALEAIVADSLELRRGVVDLAAAAVEEQSQEFVEHRWAELGLARVVATVGAACPAGVAA